MNKKKIFIAILAVIIGIITGLGFYETNKDKSTGEVIESVINDVQDVIEENESSTEIPELTEDDEQALEEQIVEDESFELQGDIAYEGDAKTWNLTTGDTPQLTYISQIYIRWKNYPYTSVGNSSQTIGSSGCGVASAAMIIDSIVGNVDVKELADTFVANGYRSANNRNLLECI